MAGDSSESAVDFKTILRSRPSTFSGESTFLAIRILVQTVPVFLAAGMRFAVVGLLMFLWVHWRGGPSLSRLEWKNVLDSWWSSLSFSLCGLFWAEKTVPSEIASVLVATIPALDRSAGITRVQSGADDRLSNVDRMGFAGVIIVARGGDESGGHFKALPAWF